MGSLAHLLATRPEIVEPWLTDGSRDQGSTFTALNTAFMEDGAFVEIARDSVIDRPVHVVFYSTGGAAPAVSHPRLLVVAGEHSEASVVETYVGAAGQDVLHQHGVGILRRPPRDPQSLPGAARESVRLSRGDAGRAHRTRERVPVAQFRRSARPLRETTSPPFWAARAATPR